MATTLESAADTIKDVNSSIADTLGDAASYIRNKKFTDMWDDAQGGVKAYPAAALIGAVAVGFVVGRLLRR